MNDIQRRVRKLLNDGSQECWNEIIQSILATDLKFFEHEQPTLDRQVYFMLNQLLDILNLERRKEYHKIPYEFADLLSMAVGYMALYGDPAKFVSHRVALNGHVKGEKEIAQKYEARWKLYGQESLNRLYEILNLHGEAYFQAASSKPLETVSFDSRQDVWGY